MRSRFVVFAIAISSWGCGSTGSETSSKVPTLAPSASSTAQSGLPTVAVSLASVGLDSAALDPKADPCTDFYQYACGGWIASTEIPEDMPMWARSFGRILKHNDVALKAILEEATTATNPDPNTKKLGDFFASCMDEAAIDAAGIAPIKDLLERARRVKSASDVMSVVAHLHTKLMTPLFLFYGHEDPGDATRVIAKLDEEGLGLPDREYYLREDDDKQGIRKAYVAHIERMLILGSYDKKNAARAATEVLELETEIAKVSKTSVARLDPKGMYNLLSTNDLAQKTPHIDWNAYFKALGLANVSEVNVTSIPFFEGIDKLLTTAKPTAWQNYLAFTLLRSTARYLSKPFEDEAFAWTQRLSGQKKQKPRWKRCMNITEDELGELMAERYVAKHFGGESKQAAEQMIRAISGAFETRLRSLPWMDSKTRDMAQTKLKAMEYLVGYPAKWRTYDFSVDRTQFMANVMRGEAFEQTWRLGKIGKPVDRGEWILNAPTVNAYYDPQKNHMVFPAGVLQAPFYDVKAAPYVNYGAIGSVMGHELTHGFDYGGSEFDAKGNLLNWWEPSVRKLFEEKTACLVDQYSSYEAMPGIKVDGERTLDENIADLAGLQIAFMAYREMRKNATSMTIAEGLTEDQQFFLAMGQVWCEKSTDAFARVNLQTDVHSPGKYRVNGAVSNMSEFAQAYSCKEGTPMHPVKTCSVW